MSADRQIPEDLFGFGLACAARIADEAIVLDDGEDYPMLNHHVAASIIWTFLKAAEREGMRRAAEIVKLHADELDDASEWLATTGMLDAILSEAGEA